MFRVGDRVKVVNKNPFNYVLGWVFGLTGIITETQKLSNHPPLHTIYLDNNEGKIYIFDTELEFVNPQEQCAAQLADYISKRPYTNSALTNTILEWLTANKTHFEKD
jgi:hypothetical protein